MKAKDLAKYTKIELFKMIGDIDIKISKINPINSRDRWQIQKLENLKRKVKRNIYECVYCAEATIKTTEDKYGNEKDFILHDCGSEICPYHEYFKNQSPDSEDKLKKILKLFLKDA
jgi:DhnA family fructose-bisphosphate aldolase class Ia